jgi:hypothetical protein
LVINCLFYNAMHFFGHINLKQLKPILEILLTFFSAYHYSLIQSLFACWIMFVPICRGSGRTLLSTWWNSAVHTSREWCTLLTRLRKTLLLFPLLSSVIFVMVVKLPFILFLFSYCFHDVLHVHVLLLHHYC